MSLSVIVTSYRSPALLDRCLTSLTRQPAVGEIVVADCSPDDPTAAVRAAFPRAKVLHFASRTSVPEMRWRAVGQTGGDVIAAVEGRCVPDAHWAAELVRAHERHPAVPAIGGPVALRAGASWFDWGLYWSEFGAFAPPLADAKARQLSGANLSYKRAALEDCRDLLDAGVWEAAVHERWLRAGRPLRTCPATVVFHNGMSHAAAFMMRFQYGRSYAAGRFGAAFGLGRLLYGIGAPVLPLVLLWRTGASAHRAARAAAFWGALPWVLALDLAWSAGELVGYLCGPSSRPHVY